MSYSWERTKTPRHNANARVLARQNDACDARASNTELWLLWWLLEGCWTEHINSGGAPRDTQRATLNHTEARQKDALALHI